MIQLEINFVHLSHDRVTFDVDHDVLTWGERGKARKVRKNFVYLILCKTLMIPSLIGS